MFLAIALVSAAAFVFRGRPTISPPGPAEAAFMAKSDAAMARMATAMRIKPFGDVDRDFVAMMVPHHQGAIDMANAELSYGRNEPLRGIAQEIIATHAQQITAMRGALGAPTPPSVPSSHGTTWRASSTPGGLTCNAVASLAC